MYKNNLIQRLTSCSILLIFIVILYHFATIKDTPSIPFSTLTWNNTSDDVISTEGDNYTTYDSVYGGLCYTYPKVYDGKKGIIKYMMDDSDQLSCIAWTYAADNEDTLYDLYNNYYDIISNEFGPSEQGAKGVNNYGDVWYRDSGNILLSVMNTSELNALQYAYLSPAVSHKETT